MREKLKKKWTPEQIAGCLCVEHPEYKTNYESIYQFVYRQERGSHKYLVRSHRKRIKRFHGRQKRQPIPNRRDIEERPDITKSVGNWESGPENVIPDHKILYDGNLTRWFFTHIIIIPESAQFPLYLRIVPSWSEVYREFTVSKKTEE